MAEIVEGELQKEDFFQQFSTLVEIAGINNKEISPLWEKAKGGSMGDVLNLLIGDAEKRVVKTESPYLSVFEGVRFGDVCMTLAEKFHATGNSAYTEIETRLKAAFVETLSLPAVSDLLSKFPQWFTPDARQDRIKFWNGDQFLDQRIALAKSIFPGVTIDAKDEQFNSYNWATHRDWIYNMLASRSEIVSTNTEIDAKSKETLFKLELDLQVGRMVISKQISLNESQFTVVFAHEGVIDKLQRVCATYGQEATVAQVEKSLERIYRLDATVFGTEPSTNPGVLLGLGLVLTEDTREQLKAEGKTRGSYRSRAQNLHPDKAIEDDLPFKQLNFAYQTLDDETKFQKWKSGNTSQQCPT